jgi:hypothetical protein
LSLAATDGKHASLLLGHCPVVAPSHVEATGQNFGTFVVMTVWGAQLSIGIMAETVMDSTVPVRVASFVVHEPFHRGGGSNAFPVIGPAHWPTLAVMLAGRSHAPMAGSQEQNPQSGAGGAAMNCPAMSFACEGHPFGGASFPSHVRIGLCQSS